MTKTIKRGLGLLLALLMLVSMGAVQFAEAAATVGKVETLKVTSVTQSKAALKWSKVNGASGYCVYSYDAGKKTWMVETYTTGTTFTDKGNDVTVESHIFDYDADLYGQRLTVEFHAFLRPERPFASAEELSAQIGRDAMAAKKYFEM